MITQAETHKIPSEVFELADLLEQDWASKLVELHRSGVPMMIVGTLATADAILKDLYSGPIREQLNYVTYLLDRIERNSDDIDMRGRRAVIPVEAFGNESGTSMGDGGTLAQPQIDGELDAIAILRYHDGGLELTDALIKTATGNNAGAFVSKLDRSTKKLADSMRKNINRQAFGAGNGVITTLTSSPAASLTFTVASTQYLRVNQVIDILNVGSGAGTAVGRTITNINRSTKTVTVDVAVTATSGDGVYKEGARLQESDGLQNITAQNRVLHSINSATAGNEFWNGNRVPANGQIAGEGLFEDLIDLAGQNGQGDIEWFLTTRGVRKRLARTFYSQKRFNDAQATEIEGGYSAIHINASNARVPVISDDDCPKGWAFGGRDDAFTWGEIEEPDWLKDPKTDMIHWELKHDQATGRKKAAWQCWYIWYACLVCTAPNRTGAIPDAQDDSA